VKSDSSINSIALRKLLKRYKLTSKGKQEIIKAAQKNYSTWSGLNRLARETVFKESNIFTNKKL
tara:strand:+ start:508 stop:699 length:192 start_codon:yes stop_codon:yes gene_type:complete